MDRLRGGGCDLLSIDNGFVVGRVDSRGRRVIDFAIDDGAGSPDCVVVVWHEAARDEDEAGWTD